MMKAVLFATLLVAASTTAKADTFDAVDSYYTFGSGVSANTERLLADKAPVIGFTDLATISFILFDISSFLPTSHLFEARLLLDQDDGLAGTLIPASSTRLLNVSTYGMGGAWDKTNGNLADIEYGTDGADAFDTQTIGANGTYSWDVTELVKDWLADPSKETAIVVSGFFGNVNTDDRNTYASFYAAGSTAGSGPRLFIAPVPLPAGLPLALGGIAVLTLLRRSRKTSSRIG